MVRQEEAPLDAVEVVLLAERPARRQGRDQRDTFHGLKYKQRQQAFATLTSIQIFKHHISLVEGHLKMIDMVRKHTVEGSGNNRTIINLIDRAQNMLRDAKAVQREFVSDLSTLICGMLIHPGSTQRCMGESAHWFFLSYYVPRIFAQGP